MAPGVYSERVTMKQYVDIEGSGELTTKITFTGSASINTGTVVGASNAELRFLTAENTGGAAGAAIAIYVVSGSLRLSNVTAKASGGSGANYAISDYGSSCNDDERYGQCLGGRLGRGNRAREHLSHDPGQRDHCKRRQPEQCRDL